MIIVVEGCDNTGKSTLIQSLAERIKAPLARSYGKPKDSGDIETWHWWARACPQSPIILDRHPVISDLVYGPLLRGGTHSSIEWAREFRGDMFLIYCRPPFHKVAESIDERDQMEGVRERLANIYQSYEGLMEILDPDAIYDYTAKPGIENLAQMIFLRRSR